MDGSWRQVLIDSLSLESSDFVLDVATGTADVAIRMAKKKTLNNVVLGLDPSERMLELGRIKVRAFQLEDKVQLLLGDAQDMSPTFKDQSFTKISMSFGIRNVPNRLAALKEFNRILIPKKTSKIGILEFSRPVLGPLSHVAIFCIKYLLPIIGVLVAGDYTSYKHLADSVMAFPLPHEFVLELQAAGFEDCRVENVFLEVVHLYTCVGKEVVLEKKKAKKEEAKKEEEKEETKEETKEEDDLNDILAQSEMHLNGL